MATYTARRRDDGLPDDPWLRVLARAHHHLALPGRGSCWETITGGGEPRGGTFPLPPGCGLAERDQLRPGSQERALFLNRAGGRLSGRSIDTVLTRLGGEAGLYLPAHVLRHTFVTNLVRTGHDVVLVAELAGHRRLDTPRRYSLPSAADREAAMESVRVEY